MPELTEQQREIVLRAQEVERQRVEIYAQAVETNCADMLPESWGDFDADFEDPVEVRMILGLTSKDADILDDRECRNLVRFFGEEADRARLQRANQEPADD